jgi:hypothetical protein
MFDNRVYGSETARNVFFGLSPLDPDVKRRWLDKPGTHIYTHGISGPGRVEPGCLSSPAQTREKEERQKMPPGGDV